MTDSAHVVPGDKLTLTITGKVVDPAKANTVDATTLRIYRPAKPGSLYEARAFPGAVRVDAVLDADAVIGFEVTSQFKNGVHIDADGRYWMRRPDGWHEISVAEKAIPNVFGTQFAPRGVQRLKEDRDQ